MRTVEFSIDQGVGYVKLNRPDRLNAVVPELVEDICNALEQCLSNAVSVVVISGRGKSFCAGHDLKSGNEVVDSREVERRLERIQDITRLVKRLPCPVVASVHGYALGAGCEFALCSDLIIAAEGSVFGFPEVEVGLSVTGGISHILPMAVGLAKAKELLFLGERMSAREAHSLGLVNWVVEDGRLEEETGRLVEQLKSKPSFAVKVAKNGVDRGSESDLQGALEREVRFTAATMSSKEASFAAAKFRSTSA